MSIRSKSNRASDSGDSDNNNYPEEDGGEEAEDDDDEYDEEYVPEWHEDYDEDDIDEDDFFTDDDESENLERTFSPYDWVDPELKDFSEMEDGEAEAPPLLKNHVALADDIKTSSHTQTPRHVTSLAFTSDSLCNLEADETKHHFYVLRQTSEFSLENKKSLFVLKVVQHFNSRFSWEIV